MFLPSSASLWRRQQGIDSHGENSDRLRTSLLPQQQTSHDIRSEEQHFRIKDSQWTRLYTCTRNTFTFFISAYHSWDNEILNFGTHISYITYTSLISYITLSHLENSTQQLKAEKNTAFYFSFQNTKNISCCRLTTHFHKCRTLGISSVC